MTSAVRSYQSCQITLSFSFLFLFFMNIPKKNAPANSMRAKGAAANATPVTEMSFSVFLNVIVSSLASLSTANSAFIAAVLEGATARELPVLLSHLRGIATSSVSFAETVYVSGALLYSVTLIFVPAGSPVIRIESPSLRLRADVAPAVPNVQLPFSARVPLPSAMSVCT